MRVDEFDFELPSDRIAQRPAEPRDSARLLRVARAQVEDSGLEDRTVRDLPDLLRPGDLLVFNDTRVIPARLTGMRGAAKISITLHRRMSADTWRALAKPAKRLRPGDRIVFVDASPSSPGGRRSGGGGPQDHPHPAVAPLQPTSPVKGEVNASDTFSAEILERNEGEVMLRFDRGGAALMDALNAYGAMPLPPYIRGGVADARDIADYQTMFAASEGAVAAPTAALHFTPALMAALIARGVKTAMLTLHVGAGTFLPVKAEDTSAHVMHEELGVLSEAAAAIVNETRRAGGRVVAVGTTSLRLLESATGDDGIVRPFDGATSIFITPGYRFKAVDLLLTNFHLPRSTLFMLVAAFTGLARMKAAYEHAKQEGYRFYSYGDCCLLEHEA